MEILDKKNKKNEIPSILRRKELQEKTHINKKITEKNYYITASEFSRIITIPEPSKEIQKYTGTNNKTHQR